MMMMIGPVWKEPATGLLGAAWMARSQGDNVEELWA